MKNTVYTHTLIVKTNETIITSNDVEKQTDGKFTLALIENVIESTFKTPTRAERDEYNKQNKK